MENGKQNGILTGLMCFTTLVISVITLFVCLGVRTALPDAAPIKNSACDSGTLKEPEDPSATRTPLYVIRTIDEKITVCSVDGEVLQILDKKPVFLPEKERERLMRGIFVYSPEEYYLVIENYME